MQVIRKISLTILLLVLFCVASKAQQNKQFTPTQLIALKFSAYTVEQDILLHKEFNKSDGYVITYACIPAGIIIIGSEKDITALEKNTVIAKIENTKVDLHFIALEGFTQKQAEQDCSRVRNAQ